MPGMGTLRIIIEHNFIYISGNGGGDNIVEKHLLEQQLGSILTPPQAKKTNVV